MRLVSLKCEVTILPNAIYVNTQLEEKMVQVGQSTVKTATVKFPIDLKSKKSTKLFLTQDATLVVEASLQANLV